MLRNTSSQLNTLTVRGWRLAQGGNRWLRTLTSSESALIPVPSIICHRNQTEVLENSHFSNFLTSHLLAPDTLVLPTVMCAYRSLCGPACHASDRLHPCPPAAKTFFFENVPVLRTCPGSLSKQYLLNGVMTVVSKADFFDKGICQNAEFASSFENTKVHSNCPWVCSTKWSMCLSLLSEFVRSIHVQTFLLSGFGTTLYFSMRDSSPVISKADFKKL